MLNYIHITTSNSSWVNVELKKKNNQDTLFASLLWGSKAWVKAVILDQQSKSGLDTLLSIPVRYEKLLE